MTTTDFTTSILVNNTAAEAFKAITNVRGWWSEEIEGGTAKLNDEFTYHYKDVHRCKIKLIEVVPNSKVVWNVLENEFNFTTDKSEWVDTTMVFEITEQGEQTHIRLTHVGLVPEYECYEICNNAWTQYIQQSLYGLITTGKGQPNAKEADINFRTTFMVENSPEEVYKAINNVPAWWSTDFSGSSEKLDDVFEVRFYGTLHCSTQKLIELVPNKKVVWLVTDSELNFLEDKSEWTGSKIIFEITEKHGQTHVHLTHDGLTAQLQCFGDCSNGWREYFQGSLQPLITTGKGNPYTKALA